MEDHAGGSVRTVFAHRDYRFLLPGFAISAVGDWLYGVSLVVLVYDRTHSAGWVAAVTITRLIPYVAFGAFGGVLADRYERRSLMLICDLARAALMILLAVLVTAIDSLWPLIVIAFLTSAASTPYQPAMYAITPAIVGEQDLAAANAVSNSVEHIAILLGPAIGGILLLLGTPAVAFALNGVSFLISGACVWAIATRSSGSKAGEDEEEAGLKKRLAQGFRAILDSKEVSMLVLLLGVGTFVYGEQVVMLVLISKRLIGTGSEGVGFLNAAVGFGGVVIAGFSNRMARATHPALLFAAGVLATGVPLALVAFATLPVVAYALMAVTGAGSILLEVTGLTMLQRSLSNEVMGRVFGVLTSLFVGSLLLGSLVTPILIDAISLKGTLVLAGLILPVVILFALPSLRSLDRSSVARMQALSGRVEELGRLSIFAGAPRQTLETIASVMTEESAEPGTDVIREGDPADDFFVVRDGELDVVAVGEMGTSPRKVNSLRPGDYFGEIGLLEGIPRTASVRAATPTRLYRISGPDFLDTVNRTPALSMTLLDGAVGRLARTHPSHEPTFTPREAT
ncbi:MAG: MFS transporter [Actinomycetota bacterium]|nr:MFS transporter [Actinomycetota bacterium]